MFLLFLPLEFGVRLPFGQTRIFVLRHFPFQLILYLSDLQLCPLVGVEDGVFPLLDHAAIGGLLLADPFAVERLLVFELGSQLMLFEHPLYFLVLHLLEELLLLQLISYPSVRLFFLLRQFDHPGFHQLLLVLHHFESHFGEVHIS